MIKVCCSVIGIELGVPILCSPLLFLGSSPLIAVKCSCQKSSVYVLLVGPLKGVDECDMPYTP